MCIILMNVFIYVYLIMVYILDVAFENTMLHFLMKITTREEKQRAPFHNPFRCISFQGKREWGGRGC